MCRARDALLTARFRGVRTVEIDGRRVTYATDVEMAATAVGRIHPPLPRAYRAVGRIAEESKGHVAF